MSDNQKQTVFFNSEGTRCAGDIYVPSSGAGRRLPAIVVGRGVNSVKATSTPVAEYFRNAGFIVLTIDYRSFGQSDGDTRGEVFPLRQVEDFRNAVSYLQHRDDVDPERIGVYGNSLGGGLVLYAAAVDRRIKAVVSVVPVVNGRRWVQSLRTRDQWEHLLDRLDADRLARYRGEPSARIPVTGLARADAFCVVPADQEVVGYLEKSQREVPTMIRDSALESLEKILEFNPEDVIHQIAPRPICVITVSGYDMIHPMEHVQRAFAKAGEPKCLVSLPYTQLALYEGSALPHSLQVAVEFLERHL